MVIRRKSATLTKEQKTGFVLLLIFAILAIALGVVQIRNTMYRPFALSNKVPPLSDQITKGVDHLRYRDTDQDGINDFDEVYTFQTSPYLDDTDSDGVTDGQEVERGTNPLCYGDNCVKTLVNTSGETFTSTTLPVNVSDPGQAPPDLTQALQDPKSIRSMLISAGVQSTLLDKITDKQLLTLVTQAMNPASSTSEDLLELYSDFGATTNTTNTTQ